MLNAQTLDNLIVKWFKTNYQKDKK
jgi:hypothetical protein